jgi:hypothetical protein
VIVKPGEIVLRWSAEGHLQINAPLDQKDACLLMLGTAIAEIAKQDAPIVLADGRLPLPGLRNHQN